MSSSETWTIGRLLTWTTDYLKQHGSESARLDAEVLLACVRKCPRIELYTAYEEPAAEATLADFRQLVRRRAAGEPVAYLVGHREFYSLNFAVTPDVLIPRPDTELVVVAVLDRIKERGRSDEIAIADVGTGSGVIAIAIATHCPRCRVVAIDCSAAALAVARQNAARHNVADRVSLVESDVLGALPPEQRFDFIASNPPYVRESEYESLTADVKNHEPKAALVAGPRGTEVTERLIEAATHHLRPGGWLIMEISPLIVESVEQHISATDGLEAGPTLRDLAGLPRVVQAQRRA